MKKHILNTTMISRFSFQAKQKMIQKETRAFFESDSLLEENLRKL